MRPVRIPIKPATDSTLKPTTCNAPKSATRDDLKPATQNALKPAGRGALALAATCSGITPRRHSWIGGRRPRRRRDWQRSADSVEKLPAFKKNPENGSVLAEFCFSTCGKLTLVAHFSEAKLRQ